MTEGSDRIILSTGVVLRAVAAPVWLIQEAAMRVGPEPMPPLKVNPNNNVEELDEYEVVALAAGRNADERLRLPGGLRRRNGADVFQAKGIHLLLGTRRR